MIRPGFEFSFPTRWFRKSEKFSISDLSPSPPPAPALRCTKDDAGLESNHYKVFLTKRKETMYDIFVEDKQPTYFDVKIFNSLDPSNNYITGYKYDIVVF